MAKYTEAQARAVKKYLADKADMRIWMPITTKERIQKAAGEAGKSVSAYVLEAVDERIRQDRDGKDIPPEFLTGLIEAMRAHNVSDKDITDILASTNRTM